MNAIIPCKELQNIFHMPWVWHYFDNWKLKIRYIPERDCWEIETMEAPDYTREIQ